MSAPADLSSWFFHKVLLPSFREILDLDDEVLLDHAQSFEPCTMPPGSESKIDMLAERVDLGLPLWHPQDAQLNERQMLQIKARGGDWVVTALLELQIPKPGKRPKKVVLEERHHTKRYRSAKELAYRKTAEYKALEVKRKLRQRLRKQGLLSATEPESPAEDKCMKELQEERSHMHAYLEREGLLARVQSLKALSSGHELETVQVE